MSWKPNIEHVQKLQQNKKPETWGRVPLSSLRTLLALPPCLQNEKQSIEEGRFGLFLLVSNVCVHVQYFQKSFTEDLTVSAGIAFSRVHTMMNR